MKYMLLIHQGTTPTTLDPEAWATLSADEQQAIAARFWQVGRLTLEPWLVPRLLPDVVTSHPDCEVTDVAGRTNEVTVHLSDGQTRSADFVVFASGYQADLARVPYLGPVLDEVSVTDGFPDLTEGFETSLTAAVTSHPIRVKARMFERATRLCSTSPTIQILSPSSEPIRLRSV